jgi:hypothetical protein
MGGGGKGSGATGVTGKFWARAIPKTDNDKTATASKVFIAFLQVEWGEIESRAV